MQKAISKAKPEKSLLKRISKGGGRNERGVVTSRHRGGGTRKLYRLVDFGQEHLGVRGTVQRLEYDPNRNAHIALVSYEDGSLGYVLAPQGVQKGSKILAAEQTEVAPGNRMKLKNIPIGTSVYNVELTPGRGGKIVRGAGTSAKILAHEGKLTLLQLPSTEARNILAEGFASVGEVSNPEHRFQKIGKAGAARRKGRRPHVRGSAMNPVDHPHGGGEGRTGIGMKFPKTPWGKHALGVKTRRKKWSDKLINARRKKNK